MPDSLTPDPATPEFLSGPGEMTALIAEFDWSRTPLGPIQRWPQSLKTMTGFLVRAPVPLVLLWGPEGVMIYNDAYSVFAGGRHPKLLGSNVREGWPEVAAFNDNVMKVGLAGGTLAYKDQELTLYRTGQAEQVWMNLDYSPVPDESGAPAGVMAVVVETTDRVLSDRRAATVQERQQQMLRQMPGFVGMLSGPDLVYEYVNDAYVEISERTDFVGRRFRDVFPDIAGQGFYEVFERAFNTGEGLVIRGMELRLHGRAETQFIDFVVEPIRDEAGGVSGVFVGGYETTDAYRSAETLRISESRLRFLDELAQATAILMDADTVLRVTTRKIAEHLGVSNCAYADMDADEDGFTIRGDWSAPGSPSIVGHYSLADFGRLAVTNLSAGLPLVINDNIRELPPEEAAAFQGIGISATICMPLVKNGRLTALMAIHDKVPRVWTAYELSLIREVTQRSWAHVERVRAEAELHASEQDFRTLARAMPNHVWTATPDGSLDWFNEQVYAYSAAEIGSLDGLGWTGLVHPDDLSAAAARWTEALATGETYQVEFRLRRADGVYRWHIARAAPLKGEFGQIIRWIGTNTDIQDQKAILEALEASEASLLALNADLERQVIERIRERSRIWEVSPDLLSVIKPDGYFETTNPAWQHVLGWSAQELASAPCFDFIYPADLERSFAEFSELERGNPVLRFENRYIRKGGGECWLSWVAVPIEGKFYCGARDITAEKDAQAELLKAQEALRQSQKMEAVGQLTGGIAHDFNNLLAGISGSLELLEKRIAEGRLTGVERYISAAQGASRRAAALTQRLLAFSRRQTLDPRPTDVNKLIGGMEELIRRSIGPTVELEVVGAGGLWTTLIDPSQLENALLNLCINGRDAMAPDGGRLTIETANKWLDERAAREREVPAGQYISVCVTDTGTGMSPEIVARAFDPFFTTKPIGQGTGLGLSMIHGFVRQSGGQVRIYSEPGAGTTMCLYLPRFAGEALVASAEAVPDSEDGRGETVLVIDDEATVRMLVVEVLEEAGYIVMQAKDGPSGLKILQSDARIDLLVTDVGLPGGMNGRQVADAARASRPSMKVLFVTGYAENAAVGNGHLDPGMQVITKPFPMAAFGNKVREMLEG